MEELRKLSEHNKIVSEQMMKLSKDNEMLKEQNQQLFERDRKNKNNIANVVHLLSKLMKRKNKHGNYSTDLPELMSAVSNSSESFFPSEFNGTKAITAPPKNHELMAAALEQEKRVTRSGKRSYAQANIGPSGQNRRGKGSKGEPLPEKGAKSPVIEHPPASASPPSIKEVTVTNDVDDPLDWMNESSTLVSNIKKQTEMVKVLGRQIFFPLRVFFFGVHTPPLTATCYRTSTKNSSPAET